MLWGGGVGVWVYMCLWVCQCMHQPIFAVSMFHQCPRLTQFTIANPITFEAFLAAATQL